MKFAEVKEMSSPVSGTASKRIVKETATKSVRSRTPAARAQRKEQILDAAARTFAEVGYSEAEMETIAERIGIAKGTVYLYFDGKQGLFFACVDEGLKQMQSRVDAAIANLKDPFAIIAAAIESYLKFFDENAHFVELFIQERAIFRETRRSSYFQHHERRLGVWHDMYATMAETGKIRNDIPSENLVEAASCLVFGAMYTNRLAGRSVSVEDQARILTEFVLSGLRAKTT